MSISWDEWIADSQRLKQTRHADLARALYWFQVARQQLNDNPKSFQWLEALAESCASLHEMLPDKEDYEAPDVSIALLDAVVDLRNGLRPAWMTPTALPPSRRPPSSRDQALRRVLVDSVKGLQELFGYKERPACKLVVDRIGARTDASPEALRRWVRSGEYDGSDLVSSAGLYDGDTEKDWLDATVRAFEEIARYPGATPTSR